MKNLFLSTFFLLLFFGLAVSCSRSAESRASLLEDAELAYGTGHFDDARQIVDSISAGTLQNFDVSTLCRLSLLYVRLGERSDEEVNFANAARAIEAAALRDNDSTMTFFRSLPVEDQARFRLVEAISEGSKHILSPDSLFAEPDSLFFQ